MKKLETHQIVLIAGVVIALVSLAVGILKINNEKETSSKELSMPFSSEEQVSTLPPVCNTAIDIAALNNMIAAANQNLAQTYVNTLINSAVAYMTEDSKEKFLEEELLEINHKILKVDNIMANEIKEAFIKALMAENPNWTREKAESVTKERYAQALQIWMDVFNSMGRVLIHALEEAGIEWSPNEL